MGVKRKQPDSVRDDDNDDGSDYDVVAQDDGNDVDIAAALVGDNADDGSGDEDFIRDTLRKKHVKDGAELVKQAKGKGKSHVKKGELGGGSFQSMGLHPSLLRALTLRGYRAPTPIQRLTVPALLASPPRDLVGMARTGSGKTLAYMIPLVQRLGGQHSTAFGARALILIPTRELALQVMKVGKDLSRGWHAGSGGDHAGDGESSTAGGVLRWGLVVGGEGMDDQFEMLTSNPDVIIATPGRLLHVAVEMNLDLRSVQYVVFDEADRLFELGFAVAMNEILGRLPSSRQTLLFSATLPKTLVEFAKAGLQNPKLVRLDAESKISADLRMVFFSVKQAEKDACLLVLLRDVINVPLGSEAARDKKDSQMAPHQTIVFVATKHHVEYVSSLLSTAGYAVSHIYGALDQVARSMQMDRFRRGITSVLVVTDVAARGIDIPVLENVVNYDFPQGSRIFVHRVGRTARAGRKGWAWSFVTNAELPHLLDLQLFLARPLASVAPAGIQSYVDTLVLGPFVRETLDAESEFIDTLDEKNSALPTLRDVMLKGQRMYEKSQGKASQASYKRAKEMTKDPAWPLAGSSTEQSRVHPILAGTKSSDEAARTALLSAVNAFRPAETVFELGTRGKAGAAALMKDRRKALAKAVHRAPVASTSALPEVERAPATPLAVQDAADEQDIQAVFGPSHKKARLAKEDFQDSEFYMSHYQKDSATEKGYSLRDGASFAEQASNATFDLLTDEGTQEQKRLRSQVKWDRKKKKFVKGTGEGADNVKIIKTESGTRLPATYRTGRFEEWKKQHRTSLPRVGETENATTSGRGFNSGARRFKHNKATQAKPLDKLAKNFERKLRKQSSKDGGSGDGAPPTPSKGGPKTKVASKFAGGKPAGKARQELKSAEQIRKTRQIAEQRRAKNARAPPRGKGKGKGKGRH
ncbi:DEAD-domain-containing protein [Exidia glandulosa HHB12029]|uniref:RNA helicase n=1 Tax=Exidia glandulosa HHB12029 TaxID=1314781 RepID=A0A165N5B5_EXIGL|nr:DEAD-domain-containing protein [Exidia glandulosa HHB12029]